MPLHQRIELARVRRGLSRRALGDLIGRSAEWVRQVERGDRSVDRLSILLRLGAVLQISTVGRAVSSRAGRPAAGVDAVRNAVYELPPIERISPDRYAAVPAPEVDRRTADVWARWHDSATPYAAAFRALPAVLRALAGYPLRAEIGVSAAHAYRLASEILRRLGDRPAALLAAQRAVDAARAGGCRSAVAAAISGYADTLVELGAAEPVEDLCRRAIKAVDPVDPAAGLLHLSAARAAIVGHAPQSARAWLDGAAQLAEHTPAAGVDARYPFGRVDVQIEGVRVALRLGHLSDAVRLAHGVDVTALPSRVRRARGFVAVAVVHARAANPAAVLVALGKAEDACAEELRYSDEARRVIVDLLGHDDALIGRDVWALASRYGLT